MLEETVANAALARQLLEQQPKLQLVFDADPLEIPTAWLSEIGVVPQFHEISIDHLRLDLCFRFQEPFRERKQKLSLLQKLAPRYRKSFYFYMGTVHKRRRQNFSYF